MSNNTIMKYSTFDNCPNRVKIRLKQIKLDQKKSLEDYIENLNPNSDSLIIQLNKDLSRNNSFPDNMRIVCKFIEKYSNTIHLYIY